MKLLKGNEKGLKSMISKKLTILFVILASLLLITACKEEVVEEEVMEETPEAMEETSEAMEEPVLTGEPDPVEAKTELEMVTGARCINGHIEAVLTNPTDMELEIGRDAKIIINGLLSTYPVCNQQMIGPGESVYCEDITGTLSIKKGDNIKIQVNMRTERSVSVVNCSEE